MPTQHGLENLVMPPLVPGNSGEAVRFFQGLLKECMERNYSEEMLALYQNKWHVNMFHRDLMELLGKYSHPRQTWVEGSDRSKLEWVGLYGGTDFKANGSAVYATTLIEDLTADPGDYERVFAQYPSESENSETYVTFGKKWEENFWRNWHHGLARYYKRKGWLEFTPRQAENGTVYIVGSGPSLEKNWHWLKEVKKGTIIGCNEVPSFIPPELLHYYVVVDARSPSSWWMNKDMSSTEAIALVQAPNEIRDGNFKALHWFRQLNDGTRVFKTIKDRCPELPVLFSQMTVSFTALAFAVRFLKAKRIVFVGQDCAYTFGKMHCGEKDLEPRRVTEGQRSLGINGDLCIVPPVFRSFRDVIAAASYFLAKKNIEVINASEAGILDGVVGSLVALKQKTLETVIKEVEYGEASRVESEGAGVAVFESASLTAAAS